MFSKGRYTAREAREPRDVARAQELRSHVFGKGRGGPDIDDFDARCRHMIVEDTLSGALVCCFRFLQIGDGREIGQSYSAQFYDLETLEGFRGPMVEMGRFCIGDGLRDADILRVAWGAITRHVDAQGIKMLFGCTSFTGTDAKAYFDTFALLAERHLAPPGWQPREKAADVVRFDRMLQRGAPDPRVAMRMMPPLLKTYLVMGGWVSDHAVVDRALGTMHVFTGVEIDTIPPERQRLLRAVAQ